MREYLLDSNHLQPLYEKQALIMARLQYIPDGTQRVRTSTVAIAEFYWGNSIHKSKDKQKQADLYRFVFETLKPNALSITPKTAHCYSKIMSRIWDALPPSSKKTRTERHLVDNGVDINDVWMVSAAWERNMVFVTRDRMDLIREATKGAVIFENWLEPNKS